MTSRESIMRKRLKSYKIGKKEIGFEEETLMLLMIIINPSGQNSVHGRMPRIVRNWPQIGELEDVWRLGSPEKNAFI